MSFEDYVHKINQFYKRRDRMPTLSEITKLCDFKSKNSAKYLVDKMLERGLAEKDSHGHLMPLEAELRLPIVGYIQAGKTIGFPNPAEEETHDTVSLQELLPTEMENMVIFRVKGDSMIEAGITEGDALLVEMTDKYVPGDIVIALVDGEMTVKYLRKDAKGQYYLEPANASMENIYPDEEGSLEIQAVVRRTIKFHD